MRFSCKKGFTLIEMVMVMAIFSIIVMMVGSSFSTLLKYSSGFMKREESNIEGNVGLEVLRHDISSAGFGLPTSYNISGAPTYTEAADAPASDLNDASIGARIPRAILGKLMPAGVTDMDSGNITYTFLPGSDYLALKGSSLGSHPAAQRWTYASYTSLPPKTPKIWAAGNIANTQSTAPNLSPGDVVIALDRSTSVSDGGYDLLKDPATGHYWTSYATTGLPAAFSAVTPQDTVYIYGITGGGTTPVMPFNRVDYFVAVPGGTGMMPNYCAPGTGILYRGVVQHATGSNVAYQPLLDCVASMHVVLGWNFFDSTGSFVLDANKTGSGMVDTWTNAAGGNLSSTGSPAPDSTYMSNKVLNDAAQIRTKLKVVKIYLLVQNGKKDPSYTSPGTVKMYSDEEGMTPLGASVANFAVPADKRNYRWNVYKLAIRPKNLTSNQ